MSLAWINQHVEVGLLKLVPSFWGKPRIAALLEAFLRECQRLEDLFWQIQELHTIADADLARLKVLGRIVGQPRFRFDLEHYRLLVRARALANVSHGRASDLGAVLDLLLGAGQYTLISVGGATLSLTTTTTLDVVEIAMLRAVIPDVRAAGVGLQLLFSRSEERRVGKECW